MPELKKCPYCAEEIKVEAIKCRYCGERLDTNLQERDARVADLSSQKTKQPVWLFVGAYALYSGTAKVPSLGTVEATARVEVALIDLDNNRWEVAAQSRLIKKIFGKSINLGGNKVKEWLPIGEMTMVSDEAIKLAEYEGVVRIHNLGIRNCILQEYAEGKNTTLVFWDKELRWPLKYVMIFRNRREDSRSISKDIGRALQSLWMLGSSAEEISRRELAWSIDDLRDELKKSRSPSLKEDLLVLLLNETNISELRIV